MSESNSTQSISKILWRERNQAREQQRPIIHIRVTTDAIAGSPVSMPVTPERARTLGKLWALPDGSVDAAYDGHALELLLHPKDWRALLRELPHENGYAVRVPMKAGEPYRVLGIAVSHV